MDRTSKSSTAVNQLVRSHSIEWRTLGEPGVSGVFVKGLRLDEEAYPAPTNLLRFEPGATYPGHNHPGGEEIFVIEGDIKVGRDHLRAGDYLYTAPHNKHTVWSERGCVVLVNVTQQVEMLKGKR